MVPIVKFQGCRFGPQKIATNPWFHQYLTSKWEWSAAGWKCQDVFSGTNLQPWILVKGEWLWVEIYIYSSLSFYGCGIFFWVTFPGKKWTPFPLVFPDPQNRQKSIQAPKKKTQIPQDVTSKWRIPPKIPEKKSNRQPQKIRLKRMFSDHKTTDPPLELVTFTLWVQVDH